MVSGIQGRVQAREGQDGMHTITTRLTDGVYDSIAREAAGRAVSVDEVIYDMLLEGESRLPDESPEEIAAFYANEEHHMTEIDVLREWHRALAKQLRTQA
jgi:hypothetical protein